ncbi:MAG: choice-of-anchor P family protein [Geminicoccaceae bacterium]
MWIRSSGRAPSFPAAISCRAWQLLLAVLLAGSAAQPALAAPLAGGFWGDAYGMVASGMTGPLAKVLHKPAYQPIPCGGSNGATLTKRQEGFVAGTDGSVARAALIVSTLVTTTTSLTAEMHTSSTLTDVDLFGGRITAAGIRAAANVLGDAGQVSGGRDGASFTELQIDGQPVDPAVAPGTVFALPGLGTVAVGLTQLTPVGTRSIEVRVDMLTIDVVEANSFGLPVGSRLVVGHAQSAFDRSIRTKTLGGAAWVGAATGQLLEGPGFQPVNCNGTRGVTRTVDVADFSLATLRVATATTTVWSTTSGSWATVRTTSTLNAGSLLEGRISFDRIAVVAEDRFNGSTHARSTTGTAFTGLRILGSALPARVAPNLKLTLPGLGYVVVHDRRMPAAAVGGKLKVNGLRVVIDTANTLGLPIGTEITVAHADAQTKP